MKITKNYLRTVIKEELERMDEADFFAKAKNAITGAGFKLTPEQILNDKEFIARIEELAKELKQLGVNTNSIKNIYKENFGKFTEFSGPINMVSVKGMIQKTLGDIFRTAFSNVSSNVPQENKNQYINLIVRFFAGDNGQIISPVMAIFKKIYGDKLPSQQIQQIGIEESQKFAKFIAEKDQEGNRNNILAVSSGRIYK